MRFSFLGFLVAVVSATIGGGFLALVAVGLLRRLGRGLPALPAEPGVQAFLVGLSAIGVAFVAYGIGLFVRSLRRRRELRDERATLPPPAVLRRQPWLRNPSWRERRIESSSPVGSAALLLAWSFFGVPALFFLWMGVASPVKHDGTRFSAGDRAGMAGVGLSLGFVVWGLTYWRLRQARYGTSVCRLRTLPGAVGGRLEADVDCALPAGDGDEVTVRLRNLVLAGRRFRERWRMEEHVPVPVAPGRRATVPVRLDVPRVPAQEPMTVPTGAVERFMGSGAVWLLEVEKKVRGIDFKASFPVPVYDLDEVGAETERET